MSNLFSRISDDCTDLGNVIRDRHEGKPVSGTTGEQTKIVISSGKLAAEDAAAQRIREQLARDLREGKPIELAPSGDVTGQTGERKDLLTQPGKLAAEDAAAQRIREQLAKDLREGKPIELAPSGDVTGQTGERKDLLTQPGKLATFYWYERDPQRLRDEMEAMNRFFPQFKLYKKDDGRYYWKGTLRPGVLPNGWPWEVAAIYNHNHPVPDMGGSVRVVLLKPSIDTVIKALGWAPHHLISSGTDGLYLCTTRKEDMSYQTRYETTAIQTLTWAVKWLTALELVMSGELSRELFNRSDGI